MLEPDLNIRPQLHLTLQPLRALQADHPQHLIVTRAHEEQEAAVYRAPRPFSRPQ